MHVLFLSQRVPYPPNRGDKITTWRLVERMRRSHEVTVLAFAHDDADREAAAALRAMGITTVTVDHRDGLAQLSALPLLATREPLTLGVYGSRELRREAERRIAGADLAYAYSSSMGAFLLGRGLPWVMHFAELDSDKWRQYAERSRPPMSWVYRREWRTLEAYEKRLADDAATSVFCTTIEDRIFRDRIPGRPSVVLRNGVDLDGFRPDRDRSEQGHVVFTGVMDYAPNVDGCQWFVHEILPLVRARVPGARFSIVGARPNASVRRLARADGVTVTGFVPETREWLARASVAVAPLRIARGIQNKVLEAMAMGLATVGTTAATQGVEGAGGRALLVHDDAPSFAQAVSGLLLDPAAAFELGQRARSFVEEQHDWEQTLGPLDSILAACRRGGTP